MPYSLEFSTGAAEYLRGCQGLSREGRNILARSIDQNLRQLGDTLRANPALRLASGSSCFAVELLIFDPHASSPFHRSRFVVDDAGAAFGVLRVVYVDTGAPGPPA